ncbi:ferric-uptake regulator [Lucifera butyrica]|uniref:Ferric-uptake regulator n=1 Tax=Lucifera butyrica TaxID=1351585 RepID=A0A498R547_9FIRM|nr:Fur family transcriptional regulator [Lucifera butyrica]VBB05947.1 ferric-uptake regulator [Lucifera butyrica]
MELNVTAMLRDKGFKVTPQRLAIYHMLASTKSHPSAEMVFNELQPVYPTMSLATVYKTMEILEEIGLVQVLNAGEDSFRYDANTSCHPHIRCLCCGKVEDLEGINSEAFVKNVEKSTPYRITGQQFYFYGTCPKCQANVS